MCVLIQIIVPLWTEIFHFNVVKAIFNGKLQDNIQRLVWVCSFGNILVFGSWSLLRSFKQVVDFRQELALSHPFLLVQLKCWPFSRCENGSNGTWDDVVPCISSQMPHKLPLNINVLFIGQQNLCVRAHSHKWSKSHTLATKLEAGREFLMIIYDFRIIIIRA